MDSASSSEGLSQSPSSPYMHIDKLLDLRHLHFPKFKHEHPPIVNVNKVVDEQLTLGQKLADAVANGMGSWAFILTQASLLALWIVVNSLRLFFRFDPPPFILLNLILSFQASFAAPVIMMSQNRQAEKDRLTAQNDYQTDTKGEEEIRHIMEHLDHQDALILQIVQHLEKQNERLRTQHEEILSLVGQLDPDLLAKQREEGQP
ncbi:MAG TPA: DUF1003 domain-containing protein [Ktedonobacteraceae bacterium]